MALYSMLVEHEGESFSTQFDGSTVEDAVRAFLAHSLARSTSPPLGPQDIIYITPMTDLVNIWAVCAGKNGRYVNITVARTEAQQGE